MLIKYFNKNQWLNMGRKVWDVGRGEEDEGQAGERRGHRNLDDFYVTLRMWPVKTARQE